MKVERALIEDQRIYDVMYFSPMEVGDERLTNQLYFQTDMYNRTWPQMMVEKLNEQIDHLRHVELSIAPFDAEFKKKHRQVVLFHCKMALAYLDAREARIAMKLCKAAEPATRSTEGRIVRDPTADFDFLRITLLSVLACAARRVKFFQVAVDALTEAKDIALRSGQEEGGGVHPLMTALTLLNLSAVLGDLDHDEHGLRWGLEALTMMYSVFSSGTFPEVVSKYYLTLACHNAALLNVKLERWDATIELWNEGMEFTKVLQDSDDGLRRKLISIGAQAKHVPEGFLEEAFNALNGWGEQADMWNLSFWDFSEGEIKEEIHVLRHTLTLRHLVIDNFDEDRRYSHDFEDSLLSQFVLAVVCCQSLEQLTVASMDFDPHKVWRRIKKPSFLETSWYASALNFTNILESALKPEVACFRQLLQNINAFSKKVLLCLFVLGNECDGVDLSENAIDKKSISALVRALRWSRRPKFTRQVSTVILQSNGLDSETTGELARCWDPLTVDEQAQEEALDDAMSHDIAGGTDDVSFADHLSCSGQRQREPGVTSLDVSFNPLIGDKGLDLLCAGIAEFEPFRILRADTIGIGAAGCRALERIAAGGAAKLELLCLSNNAIGSEGAEVVCAAGKLCGRLHTLEMNDCGIDGGAAPHIAGLLKEHKALKRISLNRNKIGSEGAIEFCTGAAFSETLASVALASNEVTTEAAAAALATLVKACDSLVELDLSGNHIVATGAAHIGKALEHSHILTLRMEDMGFDPAVMDEFLDESAAETQDLQVIHLSGNPIADRGLTAIAECISIGLTELYLSRCSITALSQGALMNLVSFSPNLRVLDLSYNKLGANACLDMVKWMMENDKENHSLRHLELGGCGLGDEGLLILAPILAQLDHLGVRENGITSNGLEAVLNSQHMIQLSCLDLSKNTIGEQGVHALTERFQQEHKRSLWNPKQLTSSIDQVILSDNNISPGLAASTEAFIKIHNPLLNVVW